MKFIHFWPVLWLGLECLELATIPLCYEGACRCLCAHRSLYADDGDVIQAGWASHSPFTDPSSSAFSSPAESIDREMFFREACTENPRGSSECKIVLGLLDGFKAWNHLNRPKRTRGLALSCRKAGNLLSKCKRLVHRLLWESSGERLSLS